MLGGHYTYANVPLQFWMQDLISAETIMTEEGISLRGSFPRFLHGRSAEDLSLRAREVVLFPRRPRMP